MKSEMKYLTKALNDAIDNDEFEDFVREISVFVSQAISSDEHGLPTVGELILDDEVFQYANFLPHHHIFRSYDVLENSIRYQLDWMI